MVAGSVVQTIDLSAAINDNGSRGCTWDGSHLWVVDTLSDDINRFDLATDPDSPSPVYTVGSNPKGITFDGTKLRVSDGTTIHEVDPSDGSLDADITVVATMEDLAWDGSSLWGLAGDTLYELNPSTGATIKTLELETGNYSGLTWAGGSLFVLTNATPSHIKGIDPVTGYQFTDFSIDVDTTLIGGAGLAWDGESFWSVKLSNGVAYEVEPGVYAYVTGDGGVSATGDIVNKHANADIDSSASLSASGKVGHKASASIAGTGAIAADSRRTWTASATIAGTSTLAGALPWFADLDINGVTYIPRNETMRIGRTLDERATADFQIVDWENEYDFHKGQPVTIRAGAGIKLVFGGLIETADRVYHKASDKTIWLITCIDYTQLADRRVVADSYTSTDVGTIVTDLVSKLSADGVTAGTIDTGPTVTEIIFAYVSITQALNALAERSGFAWQIDANKELTFKDRSALTTTLDVSDHALANPQPKVEERAPNYRNRQYVVGGRDITDPQTETFEGDGARRSFTVGFPLAKVPTVELNTVAQTVGIKGVETGKDWYWSKGDATIVQDTGAAVLNTGDDLEITYQGLFDVVTISDDEHQQQVRKDVEGFGTGRVDHVLEEPQSTDREGAFEVAAGALGTYATIGRRLTFTTRSFAFDPGELITADLPNWGLDDVEMLVESVEIEIPEKDLAFATVVAVEGPIEGSWTAFFSKMVDKTSVLAFRENLGENEVLTLQDLTEESHEHAESITQTVFACPVFDGSGNIAFSDPGGTFALC